MESNTNITKLKKYSEAIDVDDFVDYLIQHRIFEYSQYGVVWHDDDEVQTKNSIFDLLDEMGPSVVNWVLQYLKETYPNAEISYEDKRNFQKSAVRGGLPKLPINYVKRRSLAKKLKRELQMLNHGKLIIHGMMGYGKSCLVNEVLNDLTLRKHFDNNLFWINLGEHCNVDTVIQPMWRLYKMASYKITNPLTHCLDNIDDLKHCLKDLFLEEYLENALIILDDVCDSLVLQCFDINCNIVITTQDRQILRKKEEAVFIEIDAGFSLEESLELFKKSLKVEANKDLPQTAEEIHYACKGYPMLISMIGSYLCDYRKPSYCDKELWKYIKEMLRNGDYRLNKYDVETTVPTEVLQKCISQLLTNEQQEYYEDLAIFMQDVNIPPEVLAILWSISEIDVRNLMNKFAQKSLIVVFYNNEKFIYGIHDLHLNYLKKRTEGRTPQLHAKLIDGYDKWTGGDFSRLPDDNYSFQFIGYHLEQAKAFDRFSIYLDLEFLEAKVKASGKQDVIKDIDKYKAYITKGDDNLVKHLNDLKDFLKNHGGNLYNYRHTNIIQYALQERKDSYVFKRAYELAKKSKHLYFQLQKSGDNPNEYPETIRVREDITCACFVGSPCHILTGSSKGHITYFYEQCDKPLSCFEGHNGAILNLHISPCETHFLSVSVDRKVILWKFRPDSCRNSIDHTGALPSPKTKQSEWQNVFVADRVMKPKMIFALHDDDYLISAAFSDTFNIMPRIVTGSHKGNVTIWDSEGNILVETGKRGYPAMFVKYLPGYLMFSCDDSIIRFSVNEQSPQPLNPITPLQVRCCCPFFIRDEKNIVAISDYDVVLFDGWDQDRRVESVVTLRNDSKDGKNICATITCNSKYLVIGTNRNVVLIYDIEEWKIVRRYNNHSLSKFVDTVFDLNNSVYLLLIGSDKKTLQTYYIQPVEKDLCIKNSLNFIPFWKKRRSTRKPIVALCSSEQKLQIFHSYTNICEGEAMASPITCTCFSVCGQNVIYGLENGQVRQFTIETRTDSILENLCCDSAIKHLQCFTTNASSPNVEFKGLFSNWHRRNDSISSSNDSLLDGVSKETDNGTIVIVSEDKLKIYHDQRLSQIEIHDPLVFFVSSGFVVVERSSYFFYFSLSTRVLTPLREKMPNFTVKTAAVCKQKRLLCRGFTKSGRHHFLEIFHWNEEIEKIRQEKCQGLPFEPVCSCFSQDGELLVVGMKSGLINVYNVPKNYECSNLILHEDKVAHLLFSPSVDPILVSVADQIAWWNLKSLKFVPKSKGRPPNINILQNSDDDVCQMNIDLWSEKMPLSTMPYLLSCVKLRGKPKSVSASHDFASFLVVDDKDKIDILEVI